MQNKNGSRYQDQILPLNLFDISGYHFGGSKTKKDVILVGIWVAYKDFFLFNQYSKQMYICFSKEKFLSLDVKIIHTYTHKSTEQIQLI